MAKSPTGPEARRAGKQQAHRTSAQEAHRAGKQEARRARGQAADRLGRRAEWLCRLALMLRGYRVLATRLRLPAGEIDILAERDGTLAVVEVKARPTVAEALAAVPAAAWRRRLSAVRQFVAGRTAYAGHGLRLDLMVVQPGRWPVHLPDVWQDRA